jgi:tRNA (cytidine/uridine-2'-O-)-methyltransferase
MGPETSGLPATILENLPPERLLRIPMRAGNRSLNLSNAAAVVIYEAWRQGGFPGAC